MDGIQWKVGCPIDYPYPLNYYYYLNGWNTGKGWVPPILSISIILLLLSRWMEYTEKVG